MHVKKSAQKSDDAENRYQKLTQISYKSALLGGISSILSWDQETMMPKGALENRAEQQELLAALCHKEKTSKRFSNLLFSLIDEKSGQVLEKGLKPEKKRALKMWRRDYLKQNALPLSFVKEEALLVAKSQEIWQQARKENDFALFAPFLEKIVQLNQKKAKLYGYKTHPYDALLDDFEPEMTTKEIEQVFSPIKKAIQKLLKSSSNHSKQNPFIGSFSLNKQLELSHYVLEKMGYTKEHGRLDLSTHPFSSSSHPTDSRITTRIDTKNLLSNLLVILHEGGHSLYEMGLPKEHYGTPLCSAVSLGIHESQSRLWETRIGQSKPFLKFLKPKLKSMFTSMEKKSIQALYQGANQVSPSFIRVDADELTYPLHVILRFELEKALIEGSLSVKELPQKWNEMMQDLLGITPPTDREGCLQDIHWSMGAFGYFPTYLLGTLYASCLFEGFEKEYPDWEKQVEKGELCFLREWLSDHVYRYGRQFSAKELIKKATKKSFSSEPFLHYIKNKYSKLI